MLQIVVYLRGREHREFRIDDERRAARAPRAAPARTAEPRRRPREDESEVAGAFGQRHEQLIRLRGDPDVVDVRRPARAASTPSTPRRMPRRGIGIIITPLASRLAAPRAGIFAERVPKEELLEGDCGLRIADCGLTAIADEAQRARAQAADRARGDFEHEARPPSLTRHSAWTGPWCRPMAFAARVDRLDDSILDLRRRRRRRDVDRLFEERAVERFGLVEDRQDVQRAVVQQRLDRVLASGDEALRRARSRAPRSARRAPPATAAARAAARSALANDAGSSARITPRLPDRATGLTTQGYDRG